MLQGKVVLITGGSSGIGAELGMQLAKAGAFPVLAARSQDQLQQVASRIRAAGGSVLTVPLDVTSDESVEQGMRTVIERFGRIDVLVNNAGFGRFAYAEEMDMAQLQALMDVNYFGVIRCTQTVLRYMKQAGGGHIVTVASIAGKIGVAKSAGYCASKHAVIGFMNSLRQEVEGDKRAPIHVSLVNPGPVRTAFFDKADPSGTYLSALPSWYVLKPEKVAASIVKLIRRPSAELNLPAIGSLGVKFVQLFPGLSARMLKWLTDRK